MKRDYVCTVIFDDTGDTLKPVIRKSEKSVSTYCNRVYDKYGEGISVDVSYYDEAFNLVPYERWHA